MPNFVILRSVKVPFSTKNGGDAVTEFPLIEGQAVRVGRSPALCDILIQDCRVSRVHCTVILARWHKRLMLLEGNACEDCVQVSRGASVHSLCPVLLQCLKIVGVKELCF